jgi:hypothetical protein
MSSATSTERALPSERATHDRRTGPQASTFGVWHFFVLASLVAATAAVLMSHQNTPEHLVLLSVTIGAAGAAAAGVYRTLAPLATTDRALETEPLSERLRHDLEREKRLALRSIKELEFDRAMGKVSAQDFDEMAGRLRARALGLMKQLDEGSTYRAVIERELESRVAAVAAAPAAPSVRTAAPCACGTTNDADANFCKRCGAALR